MFSYLMAEAHIMLRQATGVRDMDNCERFSHAFRILPAVDVFILGVTVSEGDRGSRVVKVLRYKSEGRWFDSRWCHWNFSLT